MKKNQGMFELSRTSKVDDVLYNEDHEVNVNQNLGPIWKAHSAEQLSESDSENGSFGNLALDCFSEPNRKERIVVPSAFSNETSAFGHSHNKATNLTQSLFAEAGLSEALTRETNICFNTDNQQKLLDLTAQLDQKTRECETLISEKKALKSLLIPVASEHQTSLLKSIWSFPSDNNKSIIELKMEINMLNSNIVDYKKQLQAKDKFIAKLHHENIAETHHLMQNFAKKTEAQKEILEEMDFKVRTMEEKLDVEKKLRENREAEISHIHNYLAKRDAYFRSQLDEKDARMQRIEANHNQEIATIARIMKQKDEEISRVNQNYNLILDKCNRPVEAINHEFQAHPLDGTRSEEIKMRSLEHSLEEKSKQLHEAYVEINNLQKELNNKYQELEKALTKLSKRKDQGVLKQQLEDVRQQISKVLTDLEEEPSSSSPASKSSIDPDLPQEFRNRIENKEEVV